MSKHVRHTREDLTRRETRLAMGPHNGAPGWFLDGKPYLPVMGQAGHGVYDPTTDPVRPLPSSSFFSAGLDIYTTWEHGPQMSLVWKAPGVYDWSEVDGYLRKIAAHDPNGRLHARFWFDAPTWWTELYPDQTVHLRDGDGDPYPTNLPSFASALYWDAAEEAARDLVRFAESHPEGWRLVAVLYHSGVCEWFPHWGDGKYSDYSPAFHAGFRSWLMEKYGCDAALRAAWKQDAVTLDTAMIPSPSARLRGDFFDLYDPANGCQRIDYCTYYSESVTTLVSRLARAFKEESGGRLYTRTMSGYQAGGTSFRYHSGPHTDFHTMLDCPWLDGFFMPHDYRGRGFGGFTAFEIPVASLHLHGKTYITEIDDRTHHHTQVPLVGATETPEDTIEVLKRDFGAAICAASGMEFKDWAQGWYEDETTMPVIAQLNRLAQESVHHNRTSTARIAVVVAMKTGRYLRDESTIYSSLNHQQRFMTYPRIGAPYDVLMVEDLATAGDYDLYIMQDTLYLSDEERQVIKEKVCGKGHTVLWFYAPGIVGDSGISLDAVSDLVGMPIQHYRATTRFHLKLIDPRHPYLTGVDAGTERPTWDMFGPLFYVQDPEATTLGMGWCYMGVNKPCFAVKPMRDWTSVYCSLPALPPAVIRNIAREAGVHIYNDQDDFVAVNDYLLCLSAASSGLHRLHLPTAVTLVDAMTGEVTAERTTDIAVEMSYGDTRLWTLVKP